MIQTCGSCGAPIRWCVTEKGRRMPVDLEPVPGGNIDLGGLKKLAVYVKPDPHVERYVSHFATCPNAAEHRKTPETDRPEPEPGPILSPDEEAHVTRARSLPATAGVEALDELAAILARADQAAVISGGRRLDYLELAGVSLGYWLRRSRTRSPEADGPDVSVPSPASRIARGADTAADPARIERSDR